MLPLWSVVYECAYQIHVPHLHICSDWLITMKANMGLYSDGTSYLGSSRQAVKKILIKGFFLGGEVGYPETGMKILRVSADFSFFVFALLLFFYS